MTALFERLKKVFDSAETVHEREQKILEEISKYESKLEKETDSEKWKELAKTLQTLKKQLQELQENDVLKLKYRIEELNKELVEEEMKNLQAKSLKEYFQYVVEKNIANIQKTSAEDLKKLVDYSSLDFDMVFERIKPKDYSYDNNYLEAIENLYKLLEEEFTIITQKTPSYLMSANDVLQIKIGNQVDICIFVCAVMHKLGDFNAKVTVALLEDFTITHFVQTKYKQKTLIFDFYNSQKYDDFLNYDEKVWKLYKPNGKTIREIKFSFNKFVYEE